MDKKDMGDVKKLFDIRISKNMYRIVKVCKTRGNLTQEKIAEEISNELKKLPTFPKENIEYNDVKIHRSNFSKHLNYWEQWNDETISNPEPPSFPEICAFCKLFNIEVSKLLDLTDAEIDRIVDSKINSISESPKPDPKIDNIGVKYINEPINYKELKKAKKSIFISGIVANIMNDEQILNILSEIPHEVEIILSVPKCEDVNVVKSVTQFFSLSETEYKTKRNNLEQQINELNRKRKVKEKENIKIINVDIFTPVSYIAIDYEENERTDDSFIQAKHYILRRIDDIHYSAYYVTVNSKVNSNEFAYYQKDINLIKSTNGKLAERFPHIADEQQDKPPSHPDNRKSQMMSRFTDKCYYAYYYDTDEKRSTIKKAIIETKGIKNSEFIEVDAIFSGHHKYLGTLTVEEYYIFINLDNDSRKERCLIILRNHSFAHLKYIGGLGCALSISTGRNVRPCFQNIFLSDIEVSDDNLAKLNYLLDIEIEIEIEKNMINTDSKIKKLLKKLLFNPSLDDNAYDEIKHLHESQKPIDHS